MGLGTRRGALAAGEDTGGFRLKEHYKQPKAKAAFFSLKWRAAVSSIGSLYRRGWRSQSQVAGCIFPVDCSCLAGPQIQLRTSRGDWKAAALYYWRGRVIQRTSVPGTKTSHLSRVRWSGSRETSVESQTIPLFLINIYLIALPKTVLKKCYLLPWLFMDKVLTGD